MASNDTFVLDVSRWVTKAQGNVGKVIAKVVVDLGTKVIRRTPIDTGRAEGNWQTQIGSIPGGETGRLGAGPSIAGLQRVATADKLGAGCVLFFTNNVPYILKLEYEGWSRQAPSGMLRSSIAGFPGLIQTASGSVRGI